MNLERELCQAAAVRRGKRERRKEYFFEVKATIILQCEPCQAAAVRGGKRST
jgi:hypothetical protein